MPQTFRSIAAGLVLIAATGCAAPEKPLTLNGNMEGRLSGDLGATLKVDGPLQMQMQVQGPTIRYEGTDVSEALFEHIEVDEVTDEWVLAVLGEPQARTRLRDGTEIWRWTYRPVEQQATVIEFFGGGQEKPELATRNTFVQIRNGVVIKKWQG